jgi:thiol-disulfide isomerase/thioredoxin
MAKYFFALGFPFVDDENAQQEQLYRALERNKDKAPVAMTVYLLRTRGGRLLTVCEWPVERDSEIEANGGLWGEGSMFRQWIGQAGGPMYQDADILGPRTHGVQEIDRPSDRSSEIVSSFSAGHPSTLGQTWKTEVTPKQKEGAVASAACPFKNDKGECVPPGERSGPACSFQLSDYERLCAVYPDHAAAAAGKHVSLREAVEEQDRRALAMQRELEERAKGPSAAEDQLLWEQLCSDKPTLLFFRAERRGGSEGAAELSAAMAPLFVHLSDDYGDRVRFIPVNADDYPDLPAKLGEHVMPIPCFALVRGGKVLGKYMGE